jgi:hypothetical protein
MKWSTLGLGIALTAITAIDIAVLRSRPGPANPIVSAAPRDTEIAAAGPGLVEPLSPRLAAGWIAFSSTKASA